MTLSKLKKKWDDFNGMKRNLNGEDALKVVNQNGDALRYVKNQTKEIFTAKNIERIIAKNFILIFIGSQIA